jgi:hypothetical protein
MLDPHVAFLKDQRTGPVRAQAFDGPLTALRVARGDNHISALLEKTSGDAFADALRGAGHDGNLAL